MTDPIQALIKEIRERCEQASDGPWEACEMMHHGTYPTGYWSVQPITEPDDMMTEGDARFVAHARQDIPWLLDQLEALLAASAPPSLRAWQPCECGHDWGSHFAWQGKPQCRWCPCMQYVVSVPLPTPPPQVTSTTGE